MNKQIPYVCAGSQIAMAGDNTVPTQIEIIPTGALRLRDRSGGYSDIEAQISDAGGLIARSMAKAAGNMIPIDFDHGIDELGTKDGRAAGWITALSHEGNRVLATVEWTAAGAAALTDKTYRFISPVFYVDAASKEVTHIARAGLTNFPALPELKILASSQENNDMPQWLKDLAAKLGMPGETDEAKITAAANGLIDQATLLTPIVAAAGLTGPLTEAGATAIVTKMTASAGDAKPDPAKFVPITALTEVTTELAALKKQVNDGDAERLVASAMADGKLSPAMKTWGDEYAAKDATGFKAWCAAAPQIVDPEGKTLLVGEVKVAEGELSADEKAIIASCVGVSEEAFLKTRQGKPPVAKKAEA